MKSIKDKLRGIIPPTVTPFNDNEEIDELAFRNHIQFLLKTGINGISIGGSMGEGYALSYEELHRLVKIGVDEVKGRIPIVAGVIRDSTRDAIKSAQAAKEAGADYLMIAPIHYFLPNDESHYAYYSAISKAVDLPIIIYNVIPTAVITPKCLLHLATIKNVVGIKQSAGDVHKLVDMLEIMPEDFAIYSAIDDMLYSTYALGAIGSISAINTVLPEISVELWHAVSNDDYSKALELHGKILPVFHAMQGVNMPAKTKEILNQRGIKVGIPRSPLHPITEEEKASIKNTLQKIGLV